ncbi:unnamed protein product [Tilletia controversa]|uniref:Lysophospholipase n=3 Tax=Tilletia TaxID=13289 RepID=A0A8X7SZU3_9BASI|nr:hypothetical protein CF336_g394 [Tilletia laevis]KAE8202850.1 hypothetical protein CF328_g1980 [Tilletia controversa]KAE8263500.1 hypothetical protein A4X03_0g1639 [Tilletia caries]KAE8207067.1 hypothetical protein CF335_g1417 [Tilletia laevis]KAE8253851.1 hypothetical protein A4X06_0g1185 [Tilletia controversa]
MLASLGNAALAVFVTLALALTPSPAQAFPAELLRGRSSPTGTYAPALVACPPASADRTNGLIRNASNYALSNSEADYIAKHRSVRAPDWASYLRRVGLDGAFPGGADNFTKTVSNLPKAALALSGGGYRATLVGGGMVQAFDGRNATANQRGTGGILQLVDYIAGLSGGSWTTGSLAINDFQSIQSLHDNVWNLQENLIIPDSDTLSFYTDLVKDVEDKANVVSRGFTAIVDYWGRALSHHLVNSSWAKQGEATTWSDIRTTSSFKNYSAPFPIVIADERAPGAVLISLNSSIWEFTPYEFGNWIPTQPAFMPIDSLGTALSNGTSQERDGLCYAGYDNFGYVVGTSSALFTSLFTSLIRSNGSSFIKDALLLITGTIAAFGNDVMQIANPLRNYGSGNNTGAERLTLVDGGLDLQNVPFWPVVQPARELDVVIAVDSSADVSNWPNGTAPNATATRGRNSFFSSVAVPNFPSPNTFVNRGLNTRPTFFACNASDALNANTAANGTSSPLVVYLPNYPWIALGNTSTFQLAYSPSESQSVIDNAFAAATLNGVEPDWPQCLACAMLERSWARTGIQRPQNCTACLDKYCWDGTKNQTVPAGAYSPPIGVPAFVSSGGKDQSAPAQTGGDGTNSGPDSANAESMNGGGGGNSAGAARATIGWGLGSGLVLSTIVLAAGLAVLF